MKRGAIVKEMVEMGKVEAIMEIPEDIYATLSTSGFSKDLIVSDLRKLLACKYYKDKVLSLGKATELSGLSKWDFIEFLSNTGVPVITHDDVNLEREFTAVNDLIEGLKR